MKKIFTLIFFIILLSNKFLFSMVLPFTTNNTYLLNINQKAKSLEKGYAENVLVFGDIANFGPHFYIQNNYTDSTNEGILLGLFRLNFISGFQARYGITDKIENQSKLYNVFQFVPLHYYPGFYFYYENAFKYNLINKKNMNFSIMHFIGIIFGGFDYASPLDPWKIETSITSGIKFVGDYKNFYYGFCLLIKYNFYELLDFFIFNRYYWKTPTFGFSFSIGNEIIFNNKVLRNEISLSCNYFIYCKDYSDGGYIESVNNKIFYDHVLNITISYNINFGWTWKKKEND